MATAAKYPRKVYGKTGARNVANYSGTEGTATNTRYSYAKPTEKPQHGLPENLGYNIQNYELPITDVDTERRNFPGYSETNYYSLDQIREGDWSGTTETDSTNTQDEATEKENKWSYTRINKTSGSTGRSWKSTSRR